MLLANAGCSTGYFDHLAHALVTGGFQTISINMRGVGGSCGSLDGATLHDLAGDVAGVIKAIGCPKRVSNRDNLLAKSRWRTRHKPSRSDLKLWNYRQFVLSLTAFPAGEPVGMPRHDFAVLDFALL